MGIVEAVVSVVGLLSAGGLAWFFFGPKEAQRAEMRGRVVRRPVVR